MLEVLAIFLAAFLAWKAFTAFVGSRGLRQDPVLLDNADFVGIKTFRTRHLVSS
jgi:hypothetical protein